MNCDFNPSLQHMAVVKLVTTLCSQIDIRDIKIEYRCYTSPVTFNDIRYSKAEKKILEKATKLPLPYFLKRKVLDIVKPILDMIKHWLHFCVRFLEPRSLKRVLNNLCWTSEGLLDRRKTVESVVQDEELDVIGRYELACSHCLEADIPKLWNKMSVIKKKWLFKECARRGDPTFSIFSRLVVEWTWCMTETSGDSKIAQEYINWHYVFQGASDRCNKAATEYVLQKLTPKDRNKSLVRTARKIANLFSSIPSGRDHLAEVFTFLLSQMTEEQEMEVFQTDPSAVLKSLLIWPRQSFFLKTAERLLGFLTPDDFSSLCINIIKKVSTHRDYYYDELFREFWQQSTMAYKEYIFNHRDCGHLMLFLFQIKDQNSIRWILKDANPEQKNKIILCDQGQNICMYLIRNGDWDSLRFFIRECIVSPNEKQKLKINLESKLPTVYKINSFYKLFEDDIQKDATSRKRKFEQ